MTQHHQPEPETPVNGQESAGRDPKTGQFVKGHQISLVHGRFSRLALIQAEPRIAELVEQVVADLGGDENVSANLRELVRSWARLCAIEDVSWKSLQGGQLSERRRARALAEHLSITRERHALSRTIGLPRRSRSVRSPEQWLKAQQQRSTTIDVPAEPAEEREP